MSKVVNDEKDTEIKVREKKKNKKENVCVWVGVSGCVGVCV